MVLFKNSALSSKNFKLYFCGNIFSVLGVWIQRLSLGWHAWQLSESAFIVGLAAAAQYLPLLILTPFFGVLADQYKPRSSAIVMHLILIFVMKYYHHVVWIQLIILFFYLFQFHV